MHNVHCERVHAICDYVDVCAHCTPCMTTCTDALIDVCSVPGKWWSLTFPRAVADALVARRRCADAPRCCGRLTNRAARWHGCHLYACAIHRNYNYGNIDHSIPEQYVLQSPHVHTYILYVLDKNVDCISKLMPTMYMYMYVPKYV